MHGLIRGTLSDEGPEAYDLFTAMESTMHHQTTSGMPSARRSKLPVLLRPLFWEYDFNALTWEDDRDLIITRVLAAGTWEAIIWLRTQLGDQSLRAWLQHHHGRGLSPRQLRFWEIILHLPHRQVNAWLQAEGQTIWEQRAQR